LYPNNYQETALSIPYLARRPAKCDYSWWITSNNPDTEPPGEGCACSCNSSGEIKGKAASPNSIILPITHTAPGWQKVHPSSVAPAAVAGQRKFCFPVK